MKENQKFLIIINGEEREAKILSTPIIDNVEYAIYSLEDEEEEYVFAARIVQDADGYDELIDIEDENIKEELLKIAQNL